jgi:hypothetical protein
MPCLFTCVARAVASILRWASLVPGRYVPCRKGGDPSRGRASSTLHEESIVVSARSSRLVRVGSFDARRLRRREETSGADAWASWRRERGGEREGLRAIPRGAPPSSASRPAGRQRGARTTWDVRAARRLPARGAPQARVQGCVQVGAKASCATLARADCRPCPTTCRVLEARGAPNRQATRAGRTGRGARGTCLVAVVV